jgi:hypothetical protein
MPQITIAITPGAGVQNALVHIDDTDVSKGGKVTISTGNHSAHWWFAGNPGSTLNISITPLSDGSTLQVSDVISPPNMFEAGDKNFSV